MNKHLLQGLVCGGSIRRGHNMDRGVGCDNRGRFCIAGFGSLRSGGRPLYRRPDCGQLCDAGGRGKGKAKEAAAHAEAPAAA